MKLLQTFATFAALLGLASAVIEPERLTLDGVLTSATCDSDAYNTGGTFKVNGYSITAPKNSLWQLPASWVPFKTICSGASRFTGNEVIVYGNIVKGQAIAGIVQMASLMLQAGSGYISDIDGSKGTMKIAGGPTIRINDPNGVYGVAYTDFPEFTADDENPSIAAFSGFPMCIPRSSSDPKCPTGNRPSGRNGKVPDPLVMAPFVVGDYLEFSGIMVGDMVVCYEIVATNVEIQSSSPVYIRVEEAMVGVVDGDPNSEFGDTRVIGYLSDPAATVVVSAIDVDPCTGEETRRVVGNAAQKANDVRQKFIWRADSTFPSKYTREYIVTVNSGTQTTKNGIVAGQYVQPMDWIMPEFSLPGADPPGYDFSSFNFLTKGIVSDDQQYGQLSPWPHTTVPAAPDACPPPPADDPTPTGPLATPTANAGSDFSFVPGRLVTLSGSNTNTDISASNLVFSWTQTSGAAVKLTNADSAKASFVAPLQAASSPKVAREFELKISQKSDSSISSTDTIIVTGDKSIKDVVTINSYTWTTTQGGTISVTASSNVVVDASAALKLFLGTSTTGLTMTSNGNGVFSFSQRSTKKPASITVKSTYGGSTTTSATTNKKKRSFYSLDGAGSVASRIKRGLFHRT